MSSLNVHTTSQINALTPITGDMVVDSDLNAVKLYDGTAWRTWNTDALAAGGHQNRWCASLDGVNDYFNIGNHVTFNTANAFSFSGWMKLNAYTHSYPSLISFKTDGSEGYLVGFSQAVGYNGVFFGSGYTAGLTTESTSVANDLLTGWKHICITYDGVSRTAASSFKLYIDGSSVSVVNSSSLAGISNDNSFGKFASRYFDGGMDDLATFNSELSAADVLKIYNGTAPNGKPTDLTKASSYDTANQEQNLTGYWRMGDDSNDSATSGGSISTITDSSGNGNDATQSTASSQPTFSDLTGETIYV